MTDTPHFTAMDAYRAVFTSRVKGEWAAIDFDILAAHINAAIAEAVKVEREACAEIAMNEGIKREDQNAPRIATAIRARGAK